jgi:UDP-glucuronate 4-epimerase
VGHSCGLTALSILGEPALQCRLPSRLDVRDAGEATRDGMGQPVRAVVTGAAGFIGSHLCGRLVADGEEVLGIDCLTDYYSPREKLANVAALREHPKFTFSTANLCEARLEGLLEGADVIFHQAAQPGVRGSWASGFITYCWDNVVATQRLLEASRAVGVGRFVYASSSSVYGNATRYPVHESDLPRPASPYGVTKLAGEHLCGLYAEREGFYVISLRYFTVYGPRQRPDMALRRLVDGALSGRPFSVFGTGEQIRDFTYVDDVVEANLLAARAEAPPGTVVNIAGGSRASVREVIDLVGRLVGREVALDCLPAQPGDVSRTEGSTERAAALLKWQPRTALQDGVFRMVNWARARLGAPL